MQRGAVSVGISVGVWVHSTVVPAQSTTIFGFPVAVSITHFCVGDGLRIITLNVAPMVLDAPPPLAAILSST